MESTACRGAPEATERGRRASQRDALVLATGRGRPHRSPLRKLPGYRGRGPEDFTGLIHQRGLPILLDRSEEFGRAGKIFPGIVQAYHLQHV